MEDIHTTLISEATPTSARDLESEQVPKLVKIPGIVVSASCINAKTPRMEGCDDHGASFSDNLYESQGEGHKLVTRTVRHVSNMQKTTTQDIDKHRHLSSRFQGGLMPPMPV